MFRSLGDSSPPDPNNDAEMLLGHADGENHDVLVNDIRGTKSEYALDKKGFQTYKLPKKEGRDTAVLDGDTSEYYDELLAMIKDIFVEPKWILWMTELTCT